ALSARHATPGAPRGSARQAPPSVHRAVAAPRSRATAPGRALHRARARGGGAQVRRAPPAAVDGRRQALGACGQAHAAPLRGRRQVGLLGPPAGRSAGVGPRRAAPLARARARAHAVATALSPPAPPGVVAGCHGDHAAFAVAGDRRSRAQGSGYATLGQRRGRVATMKLRDVPTPALVVDLAAMERNIERMATYFAGRPAKLRPHFKAHKTPAIARRQLAAGSCTGLTCATIGEAEVVASGGLCQQVLIANEIVGPGKAARAAALARTIDLIVAVDSEAALDELAGAALAAGTTIGVLVDINVGLPRCGI